MIFRKPKQASFAKIRIQILSRWLRKKEQKGLMVALTSRSTREGVTTVSSGLARSFSSNDSGKVLLLNASRKHPRRATVLDIAQQQSSLDLSEYVTTHSKFGYDMLRVASTSSNIFSNDSIPDDAPPLPDILFDDDGTILDGVYDSDAGNEQAHKLLRKLRKTYNVILVDAGSLTNSNGTFWLLNSDVNLLVIDCSKTTRESLEHQQREFENSDISIGGSILNKRKFPIPSSLYWLVR